MRAPVFSMPSIGEDSSFMNGQNIAAQLYTVREFTQTPDEIKKTLWKIKQIGYHSIQVSKTGPIEPIHLKELSKEIGLTICATHTPYERLKDDLDAVIAEHRLWNCQYVGLGAMPMEYRSGKEGFQSFIKEISGIAKIIADNGLQFVYHNHRFEFEKFDGVTGMEILFNETNPREFGFIIDTYWIQAGGANPVEWIRKVQGRMAVVHFKDMAIKSNEQIFAEIGEGNLDWPAIIKACRETGVKWYAVEQDKCLGDPFDSLATSLRFLQKFI